MSAFVAVAASSSAGVIIYDNNGTEEERKEGVSWSEREESMHMMMMMMFPYPAKLLPLSVLLIFPSALGGEMIKEHPCMQCVCGFIGKRC